MQKKSSMAAICEKTPNRLVLPLSTIHINARSMFHKLSEIKLLALKIKPAIIYISESWLDISNRPEC